MSTKSRAKDSRSRTRRGLERSGAIAALWLASMVGSQVWAEDATDHLNVRPVPLPDFRPSKPQEGFVLPPVIPTPDRAAPGGASVAVRALRFEGNTAVSSAELERIAGPFVGRRLTASELADLRNALTRHYIAKGYINSGAVIEGDALRDGVLTVRIVEGRLDEIRLRGMDGLRDEYVTQRLETPAPLDVNVLQERFQLLLADPLFARLNARLLPGAEPGRAVLDVDVARARPYQLSLLANNYLPPSVGAGALAATGSLRNLTGFGDALDFTLQDGYQSSASGRYSLAWAAPLNARGTAAALRMDHGRSAVIEEPMAPLDIRSTIDSREIELSQALLEDLGQKLTLGLARSERENRTTLLGVPYSFVPGEPDGVSKTNAWRFWQEYVRRSESQVLALRSTFSRGSNNFQAPDPALPAAVPQADAHYAIWLGQIQYARRVGEGGAQAVLRGAIQHTRQRLAPLERMSIGGVGTVRGYRENALVRDTGSVLNLEFHYPVTLGDGHTLTLVPFYDQGSGRNIDEARQTLRSAGLALNWRYRHWLVDFAKGRRLDDIPSGSGNLQDKGIHFQIRYVVF